MGVVGLILKIFTTFKDVQMMLKQFFDISTGFRFSKLQWGSVPSIPVAVLGYSFKIELQTTVFCISFDYVLKLF